MALPDGEEDITERIRCDTTKGEFTIHLFREWSPEGVDRAIELFKDGYFDGSHFFRVVPNFLVQFGISYNKELHREYTFKTIPDDPPPLGDGVKVEFHKGMISFAGGGANSRTTQMFIAYGDVKSLGREKWETPLGKVVEGMETVEALYSGYGDMPPWGKGPVQGKIHNGPSYIENEFPLLDRFISCEFLDADEVIDEEESISSNKLLLDSAFVENEVFEKEILDALEMTEEIDEAEIENQLYAGIQDEGLPPEAKLKLRELNKDTRESLLRSNGKNTQNKKNSMAKSVIMYGGLWFVLFISIFILIQLVKKYTTKKKESGKYH